MLNAERRKPGRPRVHPLPALAVASPAPTLFRLKASVIPGRAPVLQRGEAHPGGVRWHDVEVVPATAPDWTDAPLSPAS